MSKHERQAMNARMQTLHATVEAMRDGVRFSQLPYAVWRRKGVSLQAR